MKRRIVSEASLRKYKCFYRQKKDLAKDIGLGSTTIYQRAKEIEEDFWDRYGDYAVIHDGNITLINVLAFLDYMKYRTSLRGKHTRKYVPEYNPGRIARELGWIE